MGESCFSLYCLDEIRKSTISVKSEKKVKFYFIWQLTSLGNTTLFYGSVRNINGDSSASMLTLERAHDLFLG